mmetsp:Transcript_1132/g.2118  ORF Transcript_1132/g.2118 Transcript_1132/m.2118 type:complete len:192 (-) Transcript_1132:117-692(-)
MSESQRLLVDSTSTSIPHEPAPDSQVASKKHNKKLKQNQNAMGNFDVESQATTAVNAPVVALDIKTTMASERTFFKWVWTGLRVGGIGTFLIFFYESDIEFWVILFIWMVAFFLIGYGLQQYYKRRHALLSQHSNNSQTFDESEDPYAPYIVVIAITVVVSLALYKSLVPSTHHHHGENTLYHPNATQSTP